MADVKNQQDPPFTVKRKPDLCCQDQDSVANKAQKLQPENSPNVESKEGIKCGSDIENMESSCRQKIEPESVVPPEKSAGYEAQIDQNTGRGDLEAGEEEEKEESDGEEENEEVRSRREAEVDRKGKGILRDDKGKGKMIEEDDSDGEDDEDEDEEYDDEDDDSDLSDDPLAEVDLNNILPSRTRRRTMYPGVYIPDETCNQDEDEDDDDSDDSDT